MLHLTLVDGLLMVYVLAIMGLGGMLYLISAFYQKKFNQPSPKAGFIAGLIVGIVFIVSLAIQGNGAHGVRIFHGILLFGCSAGSIASTFALYFTMRKRK